MAARGSRAGAAWRDAIDRVRTSVWSIGQMAAGAGLAWGISTAVFGHQLPFFAAVAAVVCLGFAASYRVRRVAELAVGVTVGVALGEVLVQVLGRGAWQITLVVAVALVIARLLGSGQLLATQAALQAVLVLAIPQPTSGQVARWVDALIGGTVALVIAALTPPDPRTGPDAAARRAVGALVGVLRDAATAIREDDADAAGRVLARARETQALVDTWEEAVVAGEGIVRLSPMRRRHETGLIDRRRAFVGVDRALRNTRVLVRRVAGALDDGRPVPSGVADAMGAIAEALDGLEVPLGSRRHPELVAALTVVARRLDTRHVAAGTWLGTTTVAQLRAIVVDVLVATGMTARRARSLLPDPGDPASVAVDDEAARDPRHESGGGGTLAP